jgi:hypothetical protein
VLEATHALQAGRPLVLVRGADLLGGQRRADDGRDLLKQLRRLLQLRTQAFRLSANPP